MTGKNMNINILFIESDKDFTQNDKSTIRNIIDEHSKKVASILPFQQKALTFTIYPWIKKGSCAFTKTRDWIRIMLNPDELQNPIQRKETLEQLVYMIYHEMHHACRGYAGYLGIQHILIGSMISEGLADWFARQQYPSDHVMNTTSFDLKEITPYLEELDSIKYEKESLYENWMYGDTIMPRLLGYKVGRHIMDKIQKREPSLNAVTLVHTNMDEILRLAEGIL